MVTENSLSKGQVLAISGGIVSIVSVFLPWYSASAVLGEVVSSLSINGMGWKSGVDPLGVTGGIVNWEFQGIGVLALGILSFVIAFVLREKLQSVAMILCGFLIIGGGVVNLWSLREISSYNGEIISGMSLASGIGYGLYIVVLAGIVTAAGGVVRWRESDN